MEVICCPEGEGEYIVYSFGFQPCGGSRCADWRVCVLEHDECVRAVEARPACADAAWVLWLDQRDGGRFCCRGGAGDEECLGVRGGEGGDLRRRQLTTIQIDLTTSPTATTLVYAYDTTYWTNHYTTVRLCACSLLVHHRLHLHFRFFFLHR